MNHMILQGINLFEVYNKSQWYTEHEAQDFNAYKCRS